MRSNNTSYKYVPDDHYEQSILVLYSNGRLRKDLVCCRLEIEGNLPKHDERRDKSTTH